MLEPIMKVEVVVPEEYLGDVLGQVNSRRGVIQGMEVRPGNAQAVQSTDSAGRNVRICNRIAFRNTGTWRFHHGI